MRKIDLLMLTALSTAPLMGNDLQAIADSLTVPSPTPTSTRLEMPVVPGASVRLLGADYEHIVDAAGNIRPVIENTPVHVSFEIQKGDEKVVSRDYLITVPAPTPQQNGLNAKPRVIPELLSWHGSTGVFRLPREIRIHCTAPFAEQFAAELAEEAGKATGRDIRTRLVPSGEQADFTLSSESDCKLGKEGYALSISSTEVRLAAESNEGLFWATRSILQMVASGKGTLPCGKAEDAPRFALRGFMLDIARMPVPMDYLRNLVKTMAWYKMNELHLTLNNNYIFHEDYVDKGMDPFKKSYSAFRLESEQKGADGTPLTATDLAYSKAEFADFIAYARRHNVSIIPEFDTPGHALSFTRVRPDLIYQGPMNHDKRRCEMLDAANPETVSFVGKVFDEYLLPQGDKKAVFAGCDVVHVGADEFFGAAEDYRKFADGLLKHVMQRGYTPRIWGSLNTKKGTTPVQAKGVQMNLWSTGWAKAWDSIQQGFDVINTNDGALYIVPEAKYYRMDLNHKWVYNSWKPNIVGQETLPAGHPQLLGCTFAVWQDMTDRRYNGYGIYDIADMIRDSVQVVSSKAWGKAQPTLSFDEMKSTAAAIGDAPGTTLNFRTMQIPFSVSVQSLPMQLNLGTLAPNYRMTMELELPEAPAPGEEQVLLESPWGQLMVATKDGSIGLRRSDTMEFSFGVKLPVGKRVKLELIATRTPVSKENAPQSKNLLIRELREVTLLIDGQPCGKLELTGRNETIEAINTNVMLPLDVLGTSFKGKVYNLTVDPTIQK
ncbi:MAG: family 20 glycosylhydrolase [Akkermansia sp.]|nr:family 20 glycosylhydrolase [Akkermansia sp.]